jgi:transposase
MEDMIMAMGQRQDKQQEFWIATSQIVTAPGHPFYHRLNGMLTEQGFDGFVEDLCLPFYDATMGRPSIVPGVYFRMLLVGFFEGIDSERGIAWRCADSLGLREFLGFGLNEKTPDHSSLSIIRRRIDLETHHAIFAWVLTVLEDHGLLKGKTIGVDATTLEANAALKSIVRRDTGESYGEFLAGLAKASGIQTPTREDLAKLDRKRPKKGSNDDWINPNDPDAKITKMKDGRTHLAHKAEHAVDLDTGAVVAVTLQAANLGDTSTLPETLAVTKDNLATVIEATHPDEVALGDRICDVVTDKGYHSNETLVDLARQGVRSYLSEPDRGRRWEGKAEEQAAVYANHRRVRGKHGKALLRKRGELLERPFAHCYETGGMRRTHLRGHANILKRLLVHVAGCNLALVMRTLFGFGKPRRLQGLVSALGREILDLLRSLGCPQILWNGLRSIFRRPMPEIQAA